MPRSRTLPDFKIRPCSGAEFLNRPLHSEPVMSETPERGPTGLMFQSRSKRGPTWEFPTSAFEPPLSGGITCTTTDAQN
eukprot:1796493-Alexandrium_andersonii.AAC.1